MQENGVTREIAARLIVWFAASRRTLPWRENREPYRVWLSEIMLQQTRVEAVREYYVRFLQALPTVEALAEASEEKLFKLWQGLGYYSRAKNLQRAAQLIVAAGKFPATAAGWEELPGVGVYTAGAVASIAFGEAAPAVDGNVVRVVSRLTAQNSSREAIAGAFRQVMGDFDCGDFTQAWMELGATVCLPNGAPRCTCCPLAADCAAHRAGREAEFPARPVKKPRRIEEKTLLVLRCGARYALRRRPSRGLLANLWEPPTLDWAITMEEELRTALGEWALTAQTIRRLPDAKHIFTHVEWRMTLYAVEIAAMPEQFFWATAEEILSRLAVPSAYRSVLDALRRDSAPPSDGQ